MVVCKFISLGIKHIAIFNVQYFPNLSIKSAVSSVFIPILQA